MGTVWLPVSKIALGFAALPLTFRSDKQDKRSSLPDLGAVKSGSDEALHSSLIKNEEALPLDHTRRTRWEEFQGAAGRGQDPRTSREDVSKGSFVFARKN